jgi:hypothetical protein
VELAIPATLKNKYRTRSGVTSISLSPAIFTPTMHIGPSTACVRRSGPSCNAQCTVGMCLDNWNFQGDRHNHKLPVLWLPWPIVLLLERGHERVGGHWPELILRATWLNAVKDQSWLPMPPAVWVARRQEYPHATMDAESVELSPNHCQLVADHICTNQGFAGVHGDDEAFAYREILQQAVQALRHIARSAEEKQLIWGPQ